MSDQYAHVRWKGYARSDFVQELVVRYYNLECDQYSKCTQGTPVLLVRGCYATYSEWVNEDDDDGEFDERYGWVITLLVPL